MKSWVRLLPVVGSCLLSASACSRTTPSTDDPQPASAVDAQVTAEPEPVSGRFKPVATGCAEPVVRVLAEPRAGFDSAKADELVRAFVRENPEFGSDSIHYAEADMGDRRLLLARCPDADTANRIARRMREKNKSGNAVPLCGYASSGWTHATRRVTTR